MALPLVTAAVALFYLGAVPIQIAFRLKTGADGGFGLGVAVFEERFALQHAAAKVARKDGSAFLSSLPRLPAKLQTLWHAGRYALGHLRLEEIRLDGSFGSRDAALTALVCGGVSSAGCALQSIVRRAVFLNLRPDFAADGLRADLSGMICVRMGHIILAALLGILDYSAGRLNSWISTPSKAL